MVFQRKHRTQVSDKKDFFFIKTIRIAQEIETEILLITFTRVILAYVTKCKRILITKSTSFSELQNHQTPVVKLGLANLYNNFGRILSDPRQLATSHHTIGNNKRENSLMRQSYLSAAKTIQTRESAFKILNTIDKPVHVYSSIILDSIVRSISLLRENHGQLKCYQRENLLIAHNKRAFTVELFKLHWQETS